MFMFGTEKCVTTFQMLEHFSHGLGDLVVLCIARFCVQLSRYVCVMVTMIQQVIL